jgi:hypothetical protein
MNREMTKGAKVWAFFTFCGILGMLILMSSCVDKGVDTEPKYTDDNEEDVTSVVERHTEIIDGIEYHIYNTGRMDGGIFVVNHTKELLETNLKQEE